MVCLHSNSRTVFSARCSACKSGHSAAETNRAMADGAQEGVVDEFVDYGMFVGGRVGVLGCVGLENRLVEEAGAEARLGIVCAQGD